MSQIEHYTMRGMVGRYVRDHSWFQLVFDSAAWFAIAVFAAFGLVLWANPAVAAAWALDETGNALVIALAILSLLLAFLGIISTLGNERYLQALHEHGVYNTMMLQLFFNSFVAAACIALQLVFPLAVRLGAPHQIQTTVCLLSVTSLSWTVGSALTSVRTLVRYTIFRAKFVDTFGPSP